MDPELFQAVRGELPVWIGLAPILIWAPAAWLVARWTVGIAAWLAGAPLRRLPSDAHWSERARHAHPLRMAMAASTAATGVLGVLALRAGGELRWLPPFGMALAVGLCALAGATSVRVRMKPQIDGRTPSSGELLRDDAVTLLLTVPHLILALALAPAVRAPFALQDAAVVAALAAVFAAVARGGALDLLGWLRLTQPAPANLARAVASASVALGVPVPPVTVVRWGVANAFAFPLGGRLAFSTGCIEALPDEALTAVAAHELGHLSEPRPVRLLRAAMLFALLPLVGTVACVERWGAAGALAPLAVMLALALGFRGVASRMEHRADALAHAATPADVYARALARIYAANGTPAVMAGRAVHGHLYDRMLAAGAAPDFPRPAPPSQRRAWAAVAVALVWLVPAAVLLAGLPILLTPASIHGARASDLVIALEGGSEPLLRRALLEYAHGRSEPALRFAAAASAVDPLRHDALALSALALVGLGRCDEAHEALRASEALALDGADDAWVTSAQASFASCAARAAAR